MMDSMEKDWVEDETLSREETLRRFEALSPAATRGPRFVPARIVTPPNTGGGVRTDRVTRSSPAKIKIYDGRPVSASA